MSVKFAITAFGLLLGLSNSCFAATPVAKGVIRFTGSIVETHCTSSAVSSGMQLRQCPQGSRGGSIEVRRVDPMRESGLASSQVKVKLLADSGTQGRYYDQHYSFVDQSGKPLTSGTYLITFSVP